MAKPLYMLIRIMPKRVRDDMFKLHAFVSTVALFAREGNLDEFERIEHRWHTAKTALAAKKVLTPLSDTASEHSIAGIAYLAHRHGFDPAWVDAFFKSMRWDLQKHEYRSLKDLLVYTYGSAEVIGMMVVRIIGLPEQYLKPARLQGRAMQYILFLRDIAPQSERNFSYFPANDIKKYGLKNLSEHEARQKPGMFTDFVHAELLRYAQWQAEATEGFSTIPRRMRIPLQTLVDSHTWTAQRLKNDPFAAYEKRLKPNRRHVIGWAVRRSAAR